MKTLLLWQCGVLSGDKMEPEFITLEGDYRHLNDVYINAYHEDEAAQLEQSNKEAELLRLLPTGTHFEPEPSKDWDYFIHCGFLP